MECGVIQGGKPAPQTIILAASHCRHPKSHLVRRRLEKWIALPGYWLCPQGPRCQRHLDRVFNRAFRALSATRNIFQTDACFALAVVRLARLVCLSIFRRATIVSFKYDPVGNRIYKASSSGTSIFAYDGDDLIEETNATGAVVARYTHSTDNDEPLAELRSAATSYYHADGLGSITSLSNAAGALAQTYTFDSFGKLTASSGSLTNPFQFTSRELDSETNLYYFRNRYYDPQSGRPSLVRWRNRFLHVCQKPSNQLH